MAPPSPPIGDSTTPPQPLGQEDASAKLFEASHKFLDNGNTAKPEEQHNSVGHIVSEVAGTLTQP